MASTSPSAPRRHRALALLAALLTALPLIQASAVSTSYWKTDSFAGASAGEIRGTSILPDGRIVLAAALDSLSVPESQYVWGGVLLEDGTPMITTGTPGAVYELRGGKPNLILSEDTSDFPAIVSSPGGDVFIGTAPGGAVYRVTPDGEHEVFFKTGQGYVWSLAYSPEYGLIVGTGDSAKVFAVDERGKGRVLYSSDEANISAVAAVGDRVLAGTALTGRVLDVTPGADLRVVYDTGYDEISSIVRGPGGAVSFAAMTVSMEDLLDETGPASSNYGDGSVYMVGESGAVVELWRSSDAPVTTLGSTAGGDRLLAGTGSGGRVYEIAANGDEGLAADLGGDEVLFIGGGKRLMITVGAPGGAYLMEAAHAAQGRYVSDVLDTHSMSSWGTLSWKVDTPSGSGVDFAVRSGNTEEPGALWSDWVRVDGEEAGPIRCPSARFLQWKADLRRGSGDASPVIWSVEAAFLRQNLPPAVGGVTVEGPGEMASSASPSKMGTAVTRRLPDGVEVTYTIEPGESPAREIPMLLRGIRTANWSASDPDGDALSYDVLVRSDDDEWALLAGELTGTKEYTWDSQSMAGGTYQLKVVASDRRDNPENLALTGSAVSPPFLVDHAPPSVRIAQATLADGELAVTGTAEDQESDVAAVEVAVDYGEWRPAYAEDGMFDARSERFTFRLAEVSPGQHIVTVRAFDREGNPSVVRKTVR